MAWSAMLECVAAFYIHIMNPLLAYHAFIPKVFEWCKPDL